LKYHDGAGRLGKAQKSAIFAFAAAVPPRHMEQA
jgi:hypothetical protein